LPVYQDLNRHTREAAWRLSAGRRIADRETINGLWRQLLSLRQQMAGNADCPDYRAFRWRQLLRLDYTPAETVRFHEAIEEVVIPAVVRIYDKRRRRLGVHKTDVQPVISDCTTQDKGPICVMGLGRSPNRSKMTI
jgi:oligoendopeptidase F